jgi:hypothetical protein
MEAFMERNARAMRRYGLRAACLLTLCLAACGGEEEEQAPVAAAPLEISGSPPGMLVVGEYYEFVPTVANRSGSLSFTIAGKPAWATFDTTTGSLTGTPTAADVATSRISISASDGKSTVQLTPFDLKVVAFGSHSITVSWLSPTSNDDGSALSDLAGFRIHYGRQSGRYTRTIDISNPGITSYVVDGLVPGAYYFSMGSYNTTQMASLSAAEMSLVIR